MTSCLGIYVEKSLVKYAKVQKEKENIKITAFNVEFYEDLKTTLKKIISETNSSKIPISINISEELYNQFHIEASVNRKNIKKSIDTAFKELCEQKNLDNDLLDTRYILRKNLIETEKYTVLHVATPKEDIDKKKQILKDYQLQSIVPISTAIINLLDINEKENIVIVNMEGKTNITTIINGQIQRVDVLEEGISQIIDKIYKKESSIKTSYEICKNLKVHTKGTLDEEENQYIEDVMPILHKIVIETKKVIDNLYVDINKIYITGMGTSIQNLETYFQEYILNVKCKILTPFFLETSSVKTSIQDYIEVNSAIALALNGLGYYSKEFDFEKKSNFNLKRIPKEKNKNIVQKKMTPNEKLMLRVCMVFVILIVTFLGFSNSAYRNLEESNNAITKVSEQISEQYALMDNDLKKINEKTDEYTRVIENIKSLTEVEENAQASRMISKDSIPNMLNKITKIIPQQVKVLSIINETNSKQILIEAESEKYEQLGYFSSILKTENVLKNIKSTSGSKDGNVVRVTIEGELP